MKIKSFDIKAAKVPMREPHRTAAAVIDICPGRDFECNDR